ncbi:hypothetical protein LWI29_031198 [Acer saccharum]|uniref:Chromo domain-containing protein n=1 Tax=Acer saccharum TaxID=4024 RepID=A0AA39VKI3_ACESA|nr:hypothetical protein LWI29_031198 [Acer saccharum]
MVASGEKLVSGGKCKDVHLKLQKVPIIVDFFVLPLEGYDIVLGTQWLQTLGPIQWDFAKLCMTYLVDGKQVTLKARVAAVEEELLARDQALKEVKISIQRAQERMKKVYDSKHKEKEYSVGDFVYLKLQPYRQLSVSTRRNLKLSPRFYGPYEILQRVGPVAYKLKLPATSRIHSVFHISLLKKKIGGDQVVQDQLPEINLEDNHMIPIPQALLDRRIHKGKTEVLIHWMGLSPAEATWEDRDKLKSQFPNLTLEDKGVL